MNGPRGQRLIDILEGKGFVNLFKKFGFKLNLDHVFIHRDAADKLQWFHCKLYEVYPFVYINYLMSIKVIRCLLESYQTFTCKLPDVYMEVTTR